jgi:TRAP-type mannitol/chloroaromatic compound transport system permease small subunit
LRALIRCIEAISRLFGYVAAALIMLLVVLMAYEVVVRYVFSAPTIWGYEITTWVMGGSFVLAIAYALATDSHIRIDFAHDIFGRRAGRMIDLCGYVLFILPLLVWLTWGLWDYFYGAFKTGERSGQSAWNPVVWPFRLVLFVGALVWTLQVIAEIVKSAFAIMGWSLGDARTERAVTE